MKGQLLHKVFHTLTEAFQNCLRRFPSTVCFVLALTVYLVYLVATDLDDDRKLVMVLGYYFSIGTLLSLTLHLWSEEIKSKIKGVIVHILMHVLLIADAVYLYSLSPEQSLTEIGIAHGAAILALWLSAFFLSFIKECGGAYHERWNQSAGVLASPTLQRGCKLELLSIYSYYM